MMDFYEVLVQVIEILQPEGRTSYRALKRQFGLDDEYLEDLKFELIEVRECAVDRNDTMLMWTGETDAMPETAPTGSTSEPTSPPTQAWEPDPLSYTPPHLAEKILTSRGHGLGRRVCP